MKKFLTSFAVATLCSLAVNAQDAATTGTTATNPKAQVINKRDLSTQDRIEKRDGNAAKWQDASAEDKQKMMERRQKMENMSPEEREKMKATHQERKEDRSQKKEQREERYSNASPEEKGRMDQRHAIMEKLTPEQRKAAKAEMERHRAAMKQITGVDMMPQSPERN
jgi:Spy/CpxP family protein refolding chaperone